MADVPEYIEFFKLIEEMKNIRVSSCETMSAAIISAWQKISAMEDEENKVSTQEEHISQIKKENLPYPDLLNFAAKYKYLHELSAFKIVNLERKINAFKAVFSMVEKVFEVHQFTYGELNRIKDLAQIFVAKKSHLEGQAEGRETQKKMHGVNAANARHSKLGGSRDKQEQMRVLWASGNYDSRDMCAEQECAALGMSFSSARKALRNTPNPT